LGLLCGLGIRGLNGAIRQRGLRRRPLRLG